MKTSLKKHRRMSRLIKKQAADTRTVAEFCRQHRIKTGKFFYWKRKIDELETRHEEKCQSQSVSASPFIPIALPSARERGHVEKIELIFPSGVRACIHSSTGLAALETILQTCGNQ